MTQEVLNSSANNGVAAGVSVWFKPNFTGSFYEFGDCIAAGINLAPEYLEHYSYRNGARALRKKILTKRSATCNITLYEPNIYNLQRVLFGSTIEDDQTPILDEGRILTLGGSAGALTVDFNGVEDTDVWDAITIIAVYAITDVLYEDNLMTASAPTVNPSTGISTALGTSPLGQTGATTGPTIGDSVLVRYQIEQTNMYYRTEIFGATDATVEGSAKIQIRNGDGVSQVWDLASVQLSANGDIGFPLDADQTLPLTMTLSERNGSFGYVYAM